MKRTILLLCILFMLNSAVHAQSPGGVENFKVWKADFKATENINSYISNAFNFNEYIEVPVYDFYHDIEVSELDKFTLFIVYSNQYSPSIASLQTGSKMLNIHADFVEGNGIIPFESNSGRSNFLMYKGAGKKDKNIDQSIHALIVGAEEFEVENEEASICISELIIYDRILTKKEIHQIESYLAIKYGISLPANKPYSNSIGQIILDTLSIETYEHNVTGLGRDNLSNLQTNQSSNNDINSILAIGIDTVCAKNAENQAVLRDGEFMFWSNNGKMNEFVSSKNEPQISILEKQWKINIVGKQVMKSSYQFQVKSDRINNFDIKKELKLVLSDRPFNEKKIHEYELQQMTQVGEVYQCNLSLQNNKSKELFISLIQQPTQTIPLTSTLKMQHPTLVARNQNFIIEILDEANLKGELLITNVEGIPIKTKKVDDGMGSFTLEVNINVPGVYVISFIQDDVLPISGKVIVQ